MNHAIEKTCNAPRAIDPFKLVEELDFDSPMNRKFGITPAPRSLRVSPNGHFIAINSDENIYLFDLHHPMASWQAENEIKTIATRIVPTDSGGYWLSNDDEMLFVGKHRNTQQSLLISGSSFRSFWGNDNWLLIHDGNNLKHLNDNRTFETPFKHVILHAWKHDRSLRMLTISEHKKHLHLYEWDHQRITRLQTINYPYHFALKDVGADYMFNDPVHAWPNQDRSITVKLLPWAVTVFKSGKMRVSDNHMAWNPIFSNRQTTSPPVSRERLAEITACALDGGLRPLESYNTQPCLITTVLDDESIHIITTHWHKKISIADADQLGETRIHQVVGNEHIATLILANHADKLPASLAMARSVLQLLGGIYASNSISTIVSRSQPAIIALFQAFLPEMLRAFIVAEHELETPSPQKPPIDKLHAMLEKIGKHPFLAPVLFDALERLNPEDGKILHSMISPLIPLLPTRFRKRIPTPIDQHAPSFLDAVIHADIETSIFLIEHAPNKCMKTKTALALLIHFEHDDKILHSVFQRMGAISSDQRMDEYRIQVAKLSPEKRTLLHQAIGRAMHHISLHDVPLHDVPLASQILADIILSYGFVVSQPMNDPYIDFIYLLNQAEFPTQAVELCLIHQASSENASFALFMRMALTFTGANKLIPSHIHTMAKLICTENRHAMLESVDLDDENGSSWGSNDRALIEVLWHLSDGLNSSSRAAFAKVLLATIKRCHLNTGSALFSQGGTELTGGACLTAEARLLQRSPAIQQTDVFEDMGACLEMEITDTSEAK